MRVKEAPSLTGWNYYCKVKDRYVIQHGLAVHLTGATEDARTLFEGVLKSKVKADTARNALTVLQRYRFLFNLPRSIERNIRNVCWCNYDNYLLLLFSSGGV